MQPRISRGSLFSGFCPNTNTGDAPGSGFTFRSTFSSDITEDKFVTTQGTYSATSTCDGDDCGLWSMHMATFKAASLCTADDGATVIPTVANASSVPFGLISSNTFYMGCQDLIVSTNAGGGFSLTTQENRPMTAGSNTIPDTTCNGGTCTEATSAAWTTATNNGLGHTCFDQTGNDCNPVYADGDNFRQFASMSSGETAQPIMASTTPAIATGRIKFRLSVGSGQASGTYSNTVPYTLTGTY